MTGETLDGPPHVLRSAKTRVSKLGHACVETRDSKNASALGSFLALVDSYVLSSPPSVC